MLRMIYDSNQLLAVRNALAGGHVPILRTIRLTGIKRLADIFAKCPDLDFDEMMVCGLVL